MKFVGVLLTIVTVLSLLIVPAPLFAGDSGNIDVWNNFIALIEKRDSAGIKRLLSKDVSTDFIDGLTEQINSKSQMGIDALKNMKFVKEHRAAENIVKLGFEVAKAGDTLQEYLWVVLKKENGSYKILNFEPTQSLTFYVIVIKPHLSSGQEPKDTHEKIIEVLKKRLSKMEFTNFIFAVENGNIVLEISGIETMDLFKKFIVKTGSFSLNQCWFDENDSFVAANRDSVVELFEYPQFEKKNPKKYFVSKTPVVTNEQGGVSESKVTRSGLHVPQVQIELNGQNKARLEKYTEKALTAKDAKINMACVLDYKVVSTFGVGDKISSGRVWAENITLIQTASMINALIGSGPLPAGIEIVSVDKK